MEAATKIPATFRCMMCGHEWEGEIEKGEDVERACPDCRSNSVRQLTPKVK